MRVIAQPFFHVDNSRALPILISIVTFDCCKQGRIHPRMIVWCWAISNVSGGCWILETSELFLRQISTIHKSIPHPVVFSVIKTRPEIALAIAVRDHCFSFTIAEKSSQS
jgi:hypothetical protein